MAIDPLTIAGIASLLIGTQQQARAGQKVDRANAQALRNYGDKKRVQSEEARALFERRLAEQDVGNQQQVIDTQAADKVARVDALDQAATAETDPLLPGSDRAPRVVKEQNAQALASAVAQARARLKAMATLEGFSGRTFDRGLQFGQDADLFRTQASFDRGDRGVLQSEQMAASQAGNRNAMIGDVLTTLGQIGLMAGGGFGGGKLGPARPGSLGDAGVGNIVGGTNAADTINRARRVFGAPIGFA